MVMPQLGSIRLGTIQGLEPGRRAAARYTLDVKSQLTVVRLAVSWASRSGARRTTASDSRLFNQESRRGREDSEQTPVGGEDALTAELPAQPLHVGIAVKVVADQTLAPLVFDSDRSRSNNATSARWRRRSGSRSDAGSPART